MYCRSISRQIAFKAANNCLSNAEIHDTEASFGRGRKKRTVNPYTETQLSAYRQTARLQFFEIFQRQPRTHKVRGERLRSETIADRAGDDSGTAAAFLSPWKNSQLRVGDAYFVAEAENVELAAKAVEGEPVDISVGEIKQT